MKIKLSDFIKTFAAHDLPKEKLHYTWSMIDVPECWPDNWYPEGEQEGFIDKRKWFKNDN